MIIELIKAYKEMLNTLYTEEPVLSILLLIEFIFIIIIIPLTLKWGKKWDEKRLEELDESIQHIWDMDKTEDKRYVTAYCENMIKYHDNRMRYNRKRNKSLYSRKKITRYRVR